MDTLVERINKNLSLNKMEISVTDNSGTGRHAFTISGGEDLRRRIARLTQLNFTLYSLNLRLSDFGISILKKASRFKGYDKTFYDCRDYAFDFVGLPGYTFREGRFAADKLLCEDLPDLKWSPVPQKGLIAAYSSNRSSVNHWGVVVDVNDRIIIRSKWGNGHAYQHPMELFPEGYGNLIHFFKKVEKNDRT